MATNHTFNAWREILARIFDGFTVEQNITPEWLVNPETNRKLKLDLFYPEIDVAVRFFGLRGKQQRGRISDQEEAQLAARERLRQQVSAEHGVSLATLDVAKPEPDKIFNELEVTLSQANRRLAKNKALGQKEKESLLARLRHARSEVRRYERQITGEKDLALYEDLWRDRQFREAITPSDDSTVASERLPPLTEGMAVKHILFGPGIIQSLTPGDTEADTLITIRFENDEERTFLAGLLAGKLVAG
jgi:hypothetical protein